MIWKKTQWSKNFGLNRNFSEPSPERPFAHASSGWGVDPDCPFRAALELFGAIAPGQREGGIL